MIKDIVPIIIVLLLVTGVVGPFIPATSSLGKVSYTVLLNILLIILILNFYSYI